MRARSQSIGSARVRLTGFYLLLLPALLYFLVFAYGPVLNGIRVSLHRFRFIGESPFLGLENYRVALTSLVFWRVFANTVILSSWNVILTALVPMVVALFLNELDAAWFRRVVQTSIYLPHIFSWVVVGGIWIFMLSPNAGLMNGARELLDLEPIYYMATERYARSIFVGANLWKQTGFVCVLYLASLSGINPLLYEAARIDGANRFQQAIFITIPQLLETVKVVLLLNLMGALKIFDQVYVMRNAVIGPRVDVLMYHVYIQGLEKFRLGYAAAVSMIVFMITLVITLVVQRWIRYRV